MRKINIFISFIIVLVLLSVGFVQSEPQRPGDAKKMQQKKSMKSQRSKGMPNMKWWKNPRFAKELELTDDQLDKLQKLESDSRKKMIKLGADLSIKRIEFGEAMQKPDFDESAIKKLINEIAKLSSDTAKIKMGVMLDGMKILTKEQREKLISLKRRGGARKPQTKDTKKSKGKK